MRAASSEKVRIGNTRVRHSASPLNMLNLGMASQEFVWQNGIEGPTKPQSVLSGDGEVDPLRHCFLDKLITLLKLNPFHFNTY